MQDINVYEEYFGFFPAPKNNSLDNEIARYRSPKGDLGKQTPEVLTGFWGEIIKEDIVNYPPIPKMPAPPKIPEPPPTRISRM